MAVSDAILKRLLTLHPKIIDLSLDRMERLLARLGAPQERLPPVIHVAGTNGKGSTVAYLRAIGESAGLRVHSYTSPHLVRFHERIRLARKEGESSYIADADLTALLEECEVANAGAPITFFEITTAAAMLAFARTPADYLVLEVGLGGRLDATNVVARPKACVITSVDYDHEQYLGSRLQQIAHEKAGILKAGVPGIIGPQPDEAREEIVRVARRVGAVLHIAGEDWHAHEELGHLLFQDAGGLLDLPLPQLRGRFQIDNAGNAVAAWRAVGDARIGSEAIARGMRAAEWPARMQRLASGTLTAKLGRGQELWLDGGHNASAARALAHSFADLNHRLAKPLVMIVGMLASKDAAAFMRAFRGLAARIIAIAIPEEENAIPAEELKTIAEREGIPAETAASIAAAVGRAAASDAEARILIAGSLYLAGHVLSFNSGEPMSEVSGAGRR
ncbi:MAG TPA: folylpolyglutamate synthase/dihydrofolate synthase family protein [Aestuariivirgaceae bacterium]|nr:folylpolyglutamate synthase/dihydrofolate synthase family protein [Aestuariivirgaceae bacterium]